MHLPSSPLVHTSESKLCRGFYPSLCLCPMSLHSWVALNPGSLPMIACFSKSLYHPLLVNQAHTPSCCCYGTMPCSFFFLVHNNDWLHWAHESSCMRHYALMCHISHHVSTRLRCCCISMPHPSNRSWHCALVPLLGGESTSCLCHCGHWLYTTICRRAHV